MKIRNIVIALIVGPIVAYVITQVLWIVYALLPLSSYVSIPLFSDITTYSGLGIFGLIAYSGLRSGLKQGKRKRKGKAKSSLDRDVTIKDVTGTLRPSKKIPLLEFIIIGNGKNLHQIVPYKPNAEYKANPSEVKFKVDNNNLNVQKPFFGRTKLVSIFRKDGTKYKAVTVKDASKCKITAEVLSLAQRSTALENKIKQMFASHLDFKKILFFIVIGVVAVVVFLVLSGGII